MPLHSVLIVNSTGNVLFSRDFGQWDVTHVENERQFLLFRHQLLEQSHFRWKSALSKQFLNIGDVYVVFVKAGDLLLFVSGVHECDEVIRKCSSLFPCCCRLRN
jgi:hypothetical protein